jgi:hypothetical protein
MPFLAGLEILLAKVDRGMDAAVQGKTGWRGHQPVASFANKIPKPALQSQGF